MPRTPQDLAAYQAAVSSLLRKWELTNTRYLFGPARYLQQFNDQLDPEQHRFRIAARFNVVPKSGVTRPTQLSQLTAEPATNGTYALFDFTGALPRAKLYSNWQVATNADPAALEQWVTNIQSHVPSEWADALGALPKSDQATLKELASPSFSPHQTVLLPSLSDVPAPPGPINQDAGTVEFSSYAPKDIVLNADAQTPAVLLLNDKYDPNWQVTVDGKPAKLLRCNFIMRGVFLAPGKHTVEFQFKPDTRPLYVSLAAIALAVCLLGYLAVSAVTGKDSEPEQETARTKPGS